MLDGCNILVVDDEANMREMLLDLLKAQGVSVSAESDLTNARNAIESGAPDILLLDLKLPDGSGLDLLKELKESEQSPEVIMMSAFGTVESAVRAVQAGAFDFIVKPFNIEDILRVIRSAWLALPAKAGCVAMSEGIVGESQAVQDILESIRMVADSDAPVLVRGESGTGKELVARAVHLRSPRRSAPLMPINCAAIPEPLLESELFGYEKGAFSGAAARHAGKIEAAEGGTVFLDEIGDMAPTLQAKVLRALEEKVIYPVGSTTAVKTDVRFVAATNRDLSEAIRAGHFREDLYFRLNVLTIQLPPLREREGDVAVLANHFVDLFSQKYKRPEFLLDDSTLEQMQDYPWPGNVRELRNVVEKLVLLGPAAASQLPWITLERLKERAVNAPMDEPSVSDIENPAELTRAIEKHTEMNPSDGLSEILKTVERHVIVHTLNRCDGNRTETAKALGVSYKTLFNKLNEHGIHVQTRAD